MNSFKKFLIEIFFYAVPAAIFFIFLWGNINEFTEHEKIKFLLHVSIELLFYCSLTSLLTSAVKNRKSHILVSTLFYAIYILVLLLQGLSVSYGGNYLSILALENLTEGRYVGLDGKYPYIFILLFCFFIFFLIQIRVKGYQNFGQWKIKALLALLCCYQVFRSVNHQINLSELKLQYVNTPIFMLANNLVVVQKVKICNKFDVFCKTGKVTDFKFVKNHLYTKSGHLENACLGDKAKPNVIILFVEGFSSSLLNYQTEKYGELMPNLREFSKKSLNFFNYYGHTAATYRGVKGQLNSGYSEIGGSMEGGWAVKDNANILKIIRNKSLIDILNSAGYKSKFYDSIPLAHPFSVLIKSLGFQELASMDDLRGRVGAQGAFNPDDINAYLSDKDFFLALSTDLGYLKDISPFVAAAYNTGTHAFLDSGPGEMRYGIGKNEVLNRFHNLDTQLGLFLEKFNKSGLQKNTILVVTADHATYPDKPYLEIFKNTASGYFVDQIPLIIKTPCDDVRLIDVGGRNSLDLAPTIANLLNLGDEQNSFMGDSLLVKKVGLTISNFAAYGYDYYLTTDSMLYTRATVPPELSKQFDIFQGMVFDYYLLERKNSLIRRGNVGENAGIKSP